MLLYYGDNLKKEVNGNEGEEIPLPDDFSTVYADAEPYHVDANGVRYTYHYVFTHWEDYDDNKKSAVFDKATDRLYAMYDRYSVIDVPKNPYRTTRKEGEYKILSFSDLHVDAGYGNWTTATDHVFFSGNDLCIEPGIRRRETESGFKPTGGAGSDRLLKFYAGTDVTYSAGSTVYVNGAKKHYVTKKTEHYAADTVVKFTERTVISVPDGTKICFQNGSNGFTRALILTDLLIKEYKTTYLDAVMMVGDIASNEASYFYDSANMEEHIWYMLKNFYFSKLDKEGIPWFFVYANHDDFTDEEFAEIFDYSKNFIVRIGDAALLPAFDHYATPNPGDDKWGYGAKSESDSAFLRLVSALDGSCRDTVVYTHFSDHAGKAFFQWVENSAHVRAVLQGHSHYHHAKEVAKNQNGDGVWAFEMGNFSWNAETFGHAGLKDDGTVRTVGDIEGDGNTYFAGSFSFTYIDSAVINGERSLVYYFVFPEMQYGVLGGTGGRYTTSRRLEPFYQERYSTKGEVSSGGNRRYAEFPVSK